MSDEAFQQLLEAAREYLRREIGRSEPLRELVHRFGLWLVSEAEAVRDRETRPPAPAADAGPAAAPGPNGVVPLRIGNAAVMVPVAGSPEEIGRAIAAAEAEPDQPGLVHPVLERGARVDLRLVERRCRLKADACRLFIDRRAAIGDPVRERPIIDRLAVMITQAKAMPDCFLWMLWRERTQPDDATMERIARCYESLSETAALVQFCDEHAADDSPADCQDALQLLAEAGSALLVALQPTWLTAADVDQDEVHAWLSRETAVRRVFIERHMRRDDPADPAHAGTVIERAREIRSRVERAVQAQRLVRRLIDRIAYHARKVRKDGGDLDPHDWRRVCETIEELCALGLAPEDRQIARALAPLDPQRLPPEIVVTANAARAIEATRRPPAAERESPLPPEATRQWSPRVLELRRLIEGTSAVIIGGEPRPGYAGRIREAFALSDVDWVRLSEHGSGEPMRAPIERPATSLVVVLVRFVGHAHGDDAARYARRAGKPCIFVKAGYNPEQIAEAALDQAGRQLRGGMHSLAPND